MVASGQSATHQRQRHTAQVLRWWYFPVFGIVLCLSGFAVSRTWSSTALLKPVEPVKRDAVQSAPDTSHNSEGLVGPLDLDQCKHLPQLRVCSHQVHGATTTWGCLAALRELFEMGVRCFDVDLVVTSDQKLLIAHPKTLQDALQQDTMPWQGQVDIHGYSLQDLRLAGGNSSAFPTAAEFLEEFARLVREAQHDWQGWDAHRMPFVFIELKGAAYNTETINWLWAEALEAGMVDYLALYVLDDDQPVSIAQQTHWQGQLIRGFKDLPDGQDDYSIDSQGLQASAMISPSINLSANFYMGLQQTSKPVFAWVVDNPKQVRIALSRKVNGVISNDALFLKLVLKSWWKKCRSL